MATRQSLPHDEVIRQIKARVAWRQKGPSVGSIAQLTIQKEACGGETSGKALFKQRREREIDRGLCGA